MAEWLDEMRRLGSVWWQSRLLLTAAELDVVGAFQGDARTAAEVAARLRTQTGATELLLNARVGVNVLAKSGDRFQPTPEAARYLDRSSTDFRGGLLLHQGNLWHTWSQLTDAIRNGGPAPRPERPSSGRDFMLAMHHNALQFADRVAPRVDLSGAKTLLDLGGGPGTYSIAFAMRNPQLHVTIFDAPYALEVAKENVEAAGLQDRISLRPGDFLTDDIGSGYDAVFGSHIIHSYGVEDNRNLMQIIRKTLAPGGQLILHDFFLDVSRTEPFEAALFALNMLVNTPGGRSYALSEVGAWLQGAGFRSFEAISYGGPASLLVGE